MAPEVEGYAALIRGVGESGIAQGASIGDLRQIYCQTGSTATGSGKSKDFECLDDD